MQTIKKHSVEYFLDMGMTRDTAHFAAWFYKNMKQLKGCYSYDRIDTIVLNKFFKGGKFRLDLNKKDEEIYNLINDALLLIYHR